ncbi:uncharacterized protein isoform X7 [Danio rerio]
MQNRSTQRKPTQTQREFANYTQKPANPAAARVSILAYWMPDCSSTPNSVGPADQCLQYYHKLLGRCVDSYEPNLGRLVFSRCDHLGSRNKTTNHS